MAVGLLFLAGTAPSLLYSQKPTTQSRGFQLFARSQYALSANRVQCGFTSDGILCSNAPFFTSISGAFWPKGTPNNYIFNSGLQVAGIIGPDGGPWAGDTTGAFLYDPKGTTQHGLEAEPISASGDSADRADWPDVARVPAMPLYDPVLHGRVAAADEDMWWLSWEGDPAFVAGRPHPLGILADMRVLAWNQPGANEDILYVVTTLYNITSLDPASYATAPPALQPFLLRQAQKFHQLSNTKFNITLPVEGYTIAGLYAAISADADVASAGTNYSSVHLPLAMGYAWDPSFSQSPRWSFDPLIFSPPFFPGSGLVGIKLLSQPHATIYSVTENGGAFRDPWNTSQLYRYLSGGMSIAAGDEPCNLGPPSITRICYIENQRPFDIRFFLSGTPADLAPGESATFAVAYVFAAPVGIGSCAGGMNCDIDPGDFSVIAGFGDPAVVAAGVNRVDSIAGFRGALDLDGDGTLSQYEFTFEPRSLYGKAQLAQAFFDHQFLTPTAPAAPDFFLIPGDGQVTVLWRPSSIEASGDPYFDVAKDATWVPPGGTVPVPNPLYDPNFRQFDVEGYRIFRGRVDDPAALTLVAQFDYQETTISDYAGQVPRSPSQEQTCAPELGITGGCPAIYDPIAPGVARTVHNEVPLVGPIHQVRLGDRIALPNGNALILRADTAAIPLVGPYSSGLDNTGVPFVFVDSTARNSFRYFYTVTAFDLNSWQSGPSTLESSRVLKPVTPSNRAVNYQNTVDLVTGIYGRGVLLDHTAPNPSLDRVTGRFAGPFPPSNAWEIGLAGFVKELVSQPGALTARLDRIVLGSPYSSPPIPHQYWIVASAAGGKPDTLLFPITQPQEIGLQYVSRSLPAVPIDGTLAARYGGAGGAYQFNGAMTLYMEGPDYHSLYGRGCANGRQNFGASFGSYGECAYNGSRWFDGPSPQNNEARADPISGNQANLSGIPMTNYNNAGALTGVTLIHNTQAYQSVGGAEFRPMEGIKSGARRAADFNLYWGAGGTIDSVIDVTHNVPVPFAADRLGGTWGILNPSGALPSAGSYDGRDELTATDFHCIPPANDPAYNVGTASCVGGPTYTLSQTAIPGPVVPFSPDLAAAQSAPAWPDAGFGLYLSGDIFTIGLLGGQVPAPGRVWALRTYIGGIVGGNGDGGNYGPYLFNQDFDPPRSWTAVGSELRITWDVVNRVNPVTKDDLQNVHPVPDPYYFSSGYDETDNRVIKFVNLPERAIIRIYTSSGVLVALLEHNSTTFGGEAEWNVRNRDGRPVASGVYFFHIESGGARRIGRMTVVAASR